MPETTLLDKMNEESKGMQVFDVSKPEDVERLVKFLETEGENNEN